MRPAGCSLETPNLGCLEIKKAFIGAAVVTDTNGLPSAGTVCKLKVQNGGE